MQQLSRSCGPHRTENAPPRATQLRAVPRRASQPLPSLGQAMSGEKLSRRALLFGRLLAPPRPGLDLVAGGPAVMDYGSARRRSPIPSKGLAPRLVVTIDANACLPFCSVCVEQCPVSGALLMSAGHVRVDASKCTGCGDCVPLCPSPRVPLRMRRRLDS